MDQRIRETLAYASQNNIEMIDLKFCDLFGRWHHLTIPVSQFDETVFTKGVAFDGSSIPGFKKLEAGDMVLVPDIDTMLIDKFWDQPTLSFICSAYEADSLALFKNDPRNVAYRAEQYLTSTGIADTSLWSPEFEFYIFDSITYMNDINLAFYRIDSEEADWNSGVEEEQNLGHKIPRQGGYHAIPPLDNLFNLRAKMVQYIEESGIPVRYHHHEVGGPGQSEIEIHHHPLLKTGDVTMTVKYIIRMVANRHNKTVTFMPKPLYNEAGSGMHIHVQLWKNGQNLFYDEHGYAGLSQIALHFIGGVLKHGPALLAFTNPSTISYKRLVPGFEAPVKAIFGLANRSAAIRIPKYANTPETKRFEFRPPDATCNIYLAIAALLMAGIDGVVHQIDPLKEGFGPYDVNIFNMPKSEQDKIKSLPASLKEALDALADDHDFLLAGDIFSEQLIETWIDYKLNKEFNEVRRRPHPYEISLYYDV
ncbi:MAG: type I glutamate--ammonia ligase [candidate division KSB1 bacterium]|nr:type I glutamate--ammonia ligase [candidate division KSB1 bacterium]MDZ7334126.1 type I glutamate--ammonia ligase [candidate division KSB1 bacterium]MDZ7356285.1 type I glutamate--ammonia ligase [candidate division KSB1 bacterium]MDZ7401378.1 type I glutamate--ammonia ligase [candidate division KSB1 bacterium]